MKNPKVLTFPMILMGLMILILIGGCVRQPDPPGSYSETRLKPSSTHMAATSENLQFIDFHFTPLDPTDNRLKKAISQDQAVLAALQFEPSGINASGVTTQVGFSDGAMVSDLSNDRLIWLVTFHGVDSVSSGPPGSVHRVAHELTIAVDAYQGNGIVSMTLGIVTPQAEIVPTSTKLQIHAPTTSPIHSATIPPSPTATETSVSILTDPATPTPIPASWKIFSIPTLNIHFRYPAQWQTETPQRLSGTDGFVEISLMDYPASLFDVMRTVCVLEANADKPAVYGSSPLIEDWQGFDAEQQTTAGNGCLVIPSENLSSDGPAQGVLFARYPPPLMHNRLLVLRADNAHFSSILSTLRFQEYTPPAPSSGFYDSPACHVAPVGSPQVALNTDTLVITETAIANKNCDPWLHFDGFQTLVRGTAVQTERSEASQNGLRRQADENNTAWVGTDLIGFVFADTPRFPIGSPARVNITLNGKVVDTLAIAQAGPAGYPVHGFWSWNGHWLLEMDSVLVQDGKVLNQSLGYAEIFEWNLISGQPFYFYQRNGRYGINFAGQELPTHYDDIIHGQLCCDPAVYSILSAPTEVWFYALRDDTWYLVSGTRTRPDEIGRRLPPCRLRERAKCRHIVHASYSRTQGAPESL